MALLSGATRQAGNSRRRFGLTRSLFALCRLEECSRSDRFHESLEDTVQPAVGLASNALFIEDDVRDALRISWLHEDQRDNRLARQLDGIGRRLFADH